MKTFPALLALVVLVVLALGCGGPERAVGEPCLYDRECDDGFCLDTSLVDPGARGKRCTRGCSGPAECPASAGSDAECRRFGGRSLCFYGSWRGRSPSPSR